MKKALWTIWTTFLLFGFTMSAAWGNPLSLKADNGRILHPAGLGVNITGNPMAPSNFKADASYGITPAITVGANWNQQNEAQQLSFNARLSPNHARSSGYTAYAEYYPVQQTLTDVGVSFWKNFGFLYAFVNLDSSQALSTGNRETLLTPGVSMRITPRIRLATELVLDPLSFKSHEVRVGVGYQLATRLTSKTMITQNLDSDKGLTYSTGLALEL